MLEATTPGKPDRAIDVPKPRAQLARKERILRRKIRAPQAPSRVGKRPVRCATSAVLRLRDDARHRPRAVQSPRSTGNASAEWFIVSAVDATGRDRGRPRSSSSTARRTWKTPHDAFGNEFARSCSARARPESSGWPWARRLGEHRPPLIRPLEGELRPPVPPRHASVPRSRRRNGSGRDRGGNRRTPADLHVNMADLPSSLPSPGRRATA
jgi:hypothetical protein